MVPVALFAVLLVAHEAELPEGAILRLGDTRFRAGAPVRHLRFSDDGRTLHGWVNGPMGKLQPVAWNAATGIAVSPPGDLVPPDLPFNAAPAVHIGDTRVLTAGPGNAARVWDAESGREVVKLQGHTWQVSAVAASADRKRLATGDVNGLVRVWDANTFRPLVEPTGHRAWIQHAELTADGKRLLTQGQDDSLRVWDLTTGRELRAFANVPHLLEHESIIRQHPTFTPDGLAVVFCTKDRLEARDILTGLEVPLPGEMAKLKTARAVFAPDGKAVLIWQPECDLSVWDWPSGRQRFRIERVGSELGFTPDGSIVFETSGNQHRWDVKTGEKLERAWESKRNSSVEAALHLRPAPCLLVETSADEPRLFLAGTGKPPPEYPLVTIWPKRRDFSRPSPVGWPAAFSPVGRQYARQAEPTSDRIFIHEAATGEVRRTLVGNQRLLGFTPDGSRLLTTGADNAVLVWDVRLQEVPLPDALKRETSAAKLWATMCDGKAEAAYLAMARLAAEPPAAVKMARLRLKPAAKGDGENRLADTRAIELLESLDTAEAWALLEELADGEPSAWRTQEAARTLVRRIGFQPGRLP